MWTKGRKQALSEEVVEILRNEEIEFDEIIMSNMLIKKLNEKEVEEIRNVIFDISKKHNGGVNNAHAYW